MVKYLFVIFYLCVVMFLNQGHQLAKGETFGDGRRGNVRYMNANKTEVDQLTTTNYSMTWALKIYENCKKKV